MFLKESVRLSIVSAVIFIELIFLIININNFTSLYKQKDRDWSSIQIGQDEKQNSIEEIKRSLNSDFSSNNISDSLTPVTPSDIKKLNSKEQIEQEKQKKSNVSQPVIIQ
jgi:hypothetical protein